MLNMCFMMKENLYIKIKDENPSIIITRQMRAQVNTTQRQNKSKQSTKIKLKPYAKRFQGHKMTINDNNEDLRQKNYCLPQIN